MKKISTLLVFICIAMNTFATSNMKKVFINQLVEYPALNMTTKGIIDGLEDGYKQGVNLDLRVESVQQANPVLASQIAAKFIAQNAEM